MPVLRTSRYRTATGRERDKDSSIPFAQLQNQIPLGRVEPLSRSLRLAVTVAVLVSEAEISLAIIFLRFESKAGIRRAMSGLYGMVPYNTSFGGIVVF